MTIDKIHEITDMLERRSHSELQKATSFHNGYVQACEDFGRAIRNEIYNEEAKKVSRTNFNQFIYGRKNRKFAGSKKKKRRIKRGK